MCGNHILPEFHGVVLLAHFSHFRLELALVNKLPIENGKKAFIYSTSSNIGPFEKSHLMLKDKLKARGYVIVGEFSCAGYNTNSFLKIFGGLNKNRPNEEDLNRAKTFSLNLINSK